MPHLPGAGASASLPMYDLPELQPSHRALWSALAAALAGRGVVVPPDTFRVGLPPVPDRIADDVLLTQVCGFPLQTIFTGQYRPLGVPRYDLPHCDWPGIAGPSHCGVFVVAERSAARSLQDLRGTVFGCNSRHSNSGMNLPRRTLAPMAAGAPFFSRVTMTGGHLASLAAIQSGQVDAASVDCVTWAMYARHRSAAVAGLRILAPTMPSPAIPYVTSSAMPPDTVLALRAALLDVSADPACKPRLAALGLAAIEPPEGSDYGLLLRYADEARTLSFAMLARLPRLGR